MSKAYHSFKSRCIVFLLTLGAVVFCKNLCILGLPVIKSDRTIPVLRRRLAINIDIITAANQELAKEASSIRYKKSNVAVIFVVGFIGRIILSRQIGQ